MLLQSTRELKENLLSEMKFMGNVGRRIGRVYPFVGKSRIEYIYFGLIYFLLSVTSIQLFTAICLNGVTNFFEVLNVAPNLGVVIMGILKITKIHVHRDLYNKIYCHFCEDFFDVVSERESHREILRKYTAIIKKVSRFLNYCSVPLLIVVNSFPRFIMYYKHDVLGDELVYLYPFDGWYPFDKVVWYNIIYFWESFMTFVVICVYGFCNIIHAAYTISICMELKILGDSLKNLITADDVDNIVNKRNLQETHASVKKNLRNIIVRHQLLARISKELDEALGDVMLLYYGFGATIICLSLFTAVAVNDLYKTLRYFFMCCYLYMEVFIQCINGQVLMDHSLELSTAIYSADWTFADKDTKTMLLMLMARTQKPFVFTAKGYTTMNLNSFSLICKFSYNLFNLLRTAYS